MTQHEVSRFVGVACLIAFAAWIGYSIGGNSTKEKLEWPPKQGHSNPLATENLMPTMEEWSTRDSDVIAAKNSLDPALVKRVLRRGAAIRFAQEMDVLGMKDAMSSRGATDSLDRISSDERLPKRVVAELIYEASAMQPDNRSM